MFKNYFKIAFRNLLKHKVYSFINLFGLSIGIACCILIMLFIKNELSYDTFHKNADKLFRVSLFENYGGDKQFFNSITPAQFGPLLKENFPEVKNYVRVSTIFNLVQNGDKSFPEKIHLVDSSFFNVFSFKLLKGNPSNVLQNNNSVVITKSIAEKYFGENNPIGKTLSIKLDDEFHDFKITGVAEEPPSNSSIQFQILISFGNAKNIYSESALKALYVVICETYILTQPGISEKYLETKVPSLVKTLLGTNYKEGEYNLKFQPITDIHLDTNYPVGFEPISNPVYSYLLSAIALLILIIASINFILLSIGRSASRAGEIGIRKVVGAERNQLISQFWSESILTVLTAFIISIGIVEIFLPAFNNLVNKNLSIDYSLSTLLMFIGIIVFIGLLAGIYPAIVLSSFKPVEVLKGKLKLKSKTVFYRSLIITQFVLSTILITCTIIIVSQLNFIQNKNLGFNKEHVISLDARMPMDETIKMVKIFKNDLLSEPDIISVAAASNTMGTGWNFIGFGNLHGNYNKIYLNAVGYDYIKTMGIKIIDGRDFSKDFPSDYNTAVIVNEAFAKQFNINLQKDNKMPGNFPESKIIGIVKDFNYESLHTKIKPAVIVLNPDPIFKNASDIMTIMKPKIFVRIKTDNIKKTLSKLKSEWERTVPQIPYKSSFLNDDIEKQYKSETRLSSIASASSIFAILITCLGLLGMTILITVQKTKEIGIRRVLGASVGSILKLISTEFVILIISALIIGWAASYYLMNKWLEDFAYKISINFSVFIISGLIVLFISLLTISIQVVKAAIADPVKSIKYE